MPIYRIGINKPDLLRVRSEDVSVYQDPAQTEICVEPQSPTKTPGISCWTDQKTAAQVLASMAARGGNPGRIWELPAGSTYDDTKLRLWPPSPGKFYWSPARNMPGSEFIAALRAVNSQFR